MESAHTQAFRLICAETIFHKNNTDYVLNWVGGKC